MTFNSPRYRVLVPFLLLGMILLAVRIPLHAQLEEDTKGRSFWVSFLENFTSEQGIADLSLYFSSSEVATATVVYTETGKSVTISLPAPNTVVRVDINRFFGDNTELTGADQAGSEITRRTFHITSDHDITVYGLSLEKFSADAFLAYPEDVLDGRYFILAYPNMPGDTAVVNERAYHPSEFCVVGTEDNTTVQIYPRARLNGRTDNTPFTVTLEKGEVFLGQAWSRHQDVTGTEIVADHPVAVFGGIARTGIPPQEPDGRDHLVEQMLPLANWGEDVILTPFFTPTPESPYNSFARIISVVPGTVWEIDGISQGTLTPGEAVQIEVDRPMRITSSNPVMVAQYEHSVGVAIVEQNGQRFYRNGDPFMMLAVPTEQFDTAYVFQSITHPDLLVHYINVVIPTAAIASLRLDFDAVSTPFFPVPGTNFSYGQIPLRAGSHHITAAQPFGLYAYGYGGAISYGYVGGMMFRKIAPDHRTTILCENLEGLLYDGNVLRDSLLGVEISPLGANTATDIESGWQDDDTIRYRSRLSDPYQDGVAALALTFASGRVHTYTEHIPGFTLRAAGAMMGGEPLVLPPVAVFNESRFCRTITIENYGRFPRSIGRLEFLPDPGGIAMIQPQMPVTIMPGERLDVQICFQGTLDSDTVLSLRIADSCTSRLVALLPLVVGVDTTAPEIGMDVEPCGSDYDITIDEGSGFYSGIDEITIDMLKNGEVEFAPLSDSAPVRLTRMHLTHGDPREDMIYRITVRDAAGNIRVLADTVGGFTLSLPDDAGGSRALRLGGEWMAGEVGGTRFRCDSIELQNYGLRPLRLERGHLAGNIRASIPPSQFPLVIAPKSSVMLQICLDGAVNGAQIDTLTLESGCAINDQVVMRFTVPEISGRGEDLCGTVIGMTRLGPAKRTFLSAPVPNPVASRQAFVDIGLHQQERVRMDLFDLHGTPVAAVLRQEEMAAGVHRIRIDLPELSSGEYFCRMTTGSGQMLVQKLVVRE